MKGLLTLCAVVVGFAALGLSASCYARPTADECPDNGVCAKEPPTTALGTSPAASGEETLLSTLLSDGGEMEECPPEAQCAPKNDRPVPDVLGVPVERACRTLDRSAYSGGIVAVESSDGLGAGRVVAQDPKPGAGYFEGALVHLVVSGPFAVEELPRDSNCVDQTDLGIEQFPVD